MSAALPCPADKQSRSGEFVSETGFEVCFDEVEAGFPQSVGGNSTAGEEKFFCHFAEDEFCHEGWEWEESWPVKNGAEGFGEVEVGGGMGADEIDRTGEGGVFDAEGKSAGEVSESDPAPVLPPIADDSASSEFEWEQHFLKSAAFTGENDADASADDAEAEFLCRKGGFFPLAADIGEEAGAFGRVFAEDFVAAVAVEADGGGGDERFWAFFKGFQGIDYAGCALDATVADASFEGFVPASCGDVFAGEVNDGVDGVESFGIKEAAGWIPENGVVF
jgi:hypothetical protein